MRFIPYLLKWNCRQDFSLMLQKISSLMQTNPPIKIGCINLHVLFPITQNRYAVPTSHQKQPNLTHTQKKNKIYKMILQNSYINATRHPNPSKYKSVPVHRYDKFGWCIYCLEKHQFYMTYLSLHSCYCIKWYQLTRWCDTTCLPR